MEVLPTLTEGLTALQTGQVALSERVETQGKTVDWIQRLPWNHSAKLTAILLPRYCDGAPKSKAILVVKSKVLVVIVEGVRRTA